MKRRTFNKTVISTMTGMAIGLPACTKPKIVNKLSLAEWSFHRALQSGEMDNLDFPARAAELGFEGVEYVNTFFFEEAENIHYLNDLRSKAGDANIESLLIMIDEEGSLASPKKDERMEAVDRHKKWLDAAKYIGCSSVRINLFGEMHDKEAWIDYASDGLSVLCDYAKEDNMNVLVENHGWMSSNASALVQVMKNVNQPNCGTLPDFGNFCTKRSLEELWGGDCVEEYDKYLGVEELMPYAKAVSAKSYDFDEQGAETSIDFSRMLSIVHAFDYKGYIGVEYEGNTLSETEGIKATKALLERILSNNA